MEIKGKIIGITGAAGGIGRALARHFHRLGAQSIACLDVDEAGAGETAESCQGTAYTVDVSDEVQLTKTLERIENRQGPIDLFCSNAGIAVKGGVEVDTTDWQRIWDINLMAHVIAARYLIPGMIERGGGYLLNTASAAGLLSQIGSAPYAVTKHAAVALAEWLAITYGEQGIRVSVLCPQAVRTAMTANNQDGVASIDGMIEPEQAAEACAQTIEQENFLVLPHPEVLRYMRNKTDDYDKWIRGMQRLNQKYAG